MPPRICMRPLIIAVALTSKWFVRRRLLSRGVIASAHAHLASSSVASTRWQCRSVPMANFSLNILLDVVGGKAAAGEAAKAAAMAGSTSTSHEKPRHASAGPHNTRSPRRDCYEEPGSATLWSRTRFLRNRVLLMSNPITPGTGSWLALSENFSKFYSKLDPLRDFCFSKF